MDYSVIPFVVGEFNIADYGRGGATRRARIQLLPAEPINLRVEGGNRIPVRDTIARQLREQVEDALEVAATDGVGMLLDDEDDDGYPVKIDREDIPNADAILRGSTFQIVGVNGTPLQYSGRERVFKLAPSELVYDDTKYFEPDKKSMLLTDTGETASCAFQYIHQKFGGVKGFKKLAKDFRTIKSFATREPPQFKTWVKWNRDELNIEKLKRNVQHGLPDLKSFEVDLVKVDVVEIKDDEWTDEELHNSLSVLDIIRWCMWAKVSCYAIDFDGNYYLNYNHNDVIASYNDKRPKNTRSVVVKVKDNHAYFVDDKNLKIATCAVNSRYKNMDFDDVGDVRKVNQDGDTPPPPEKHERLKEDGVSCLDAYSFYLDKYEKEMEQWRKENSAELYYSPCHRLKKYLKEKGDERDRAEILMGAEGDDWDSKVADWATQFYKDNPPPLPTEFLKGDDKSYYLECRELNGIISIIANQYNKYPTTMTGRTAHRIDRCSYGKTRLFSRSCLLLEELPTDEELEIIHKEFPKLSLKRVPSYSQLANEIFKKSYNTDIFSMFNSNTRRVFMDGEIKADNSVLRTSVSADVVSIDMRRAFSTAMRDMDVKWNKFDGICQFKKYLGYFNPNLFYLVEEIGTGYPLRGGGGLKLYHGCFLRHLLGKGLIVIKYYITPIKSFEGDYFKKFLDDCDEIGLNPKHLVNNFIGSLKKDNGIAGFKFKHTESSTTLTRKFYTGSIVSTLDRNTQHNRDYRWKGDKPIFLMSSAVKDYNVQSGQPIRLQIIDKINENLYKLYHTYKVCLKFCKGFDDPKLAMVRTDALYFEDAGNKNLLDEVCRLAPMECRIQEPVKKEDWDVNKQDESFGIMLRPNRWSSVIDVDKKWSDKIGSKLIFNLVNQRGAWVQGEGGVGKSFLMNAISDIFARNRCIYKFKKAILKSQENLYWYQELEEWRNKHPCFCIKLAPTNKACNRIGGKTLNKGLGIPVIDVDEDYAEEDQVSYFEKILHRIAGDGSFKPRYDYVFVDEISMIGGYMWSLLYYIKQRVPRIKFLLCGDIKRQLPPVGEANRDFMSAYLIKELAGFTKINLNYNFRAGKSGNVLWDESSLHPELFQINAEATDTLINLSYTNTTRKKVINKLQSQLKLLPHIILKVWDFSVAPLPPNHYVNLKEKQTEELVICKGARLIANKSMESFGIAKNEVWIVSDWDDETITITYEDKEAELDYEKLWNSFYSALCITIHKSQGDTYKEKYTIHDWEKISKKGVNKKEDNFKRRLRYVAQSRSNNPTENITYK